MQGTNLFAHRAGTNSNVLEKWSLSLESGKFEQLDSTALDQALHELYAENDLLLGRGNEDVRVYSGALLPGPIQEVGRQQVSGCVYLQIDRAKAGAGGVWLPLGEYGVDFIPLP